MDQAIQCAPEALGPTWLIGNRLRPFGLVWSCEDPLCRGVETPFLWSAPPKVKSQPRESPEGSLHHPCGPTTIFSRPHCFHPNGFEAELVDLYSEKDHDGYHRKLGFICSELEATLLIIISTTRDDQRPRLVPHHLSIGGSILVPWCTTYHEKIIITRKAVHFQINLPAKRVKSTRISQISIYTRTHAL